MKRYRESKNKSKSKSKITDNEFPTVYYFDNFCLFKTIYPHENIEEHNELFTKNSAQLIAEECKYGAYLDSLKRREREEKRKDKEEKLREFNLARDLFRSRANLSISSENIDKICLNLGDQLIVLMQEDGSKSLNETQKHQIYLTISNICGFFSNCAKFALSIFKLEGLMKINKLIPVDSNHESIKPSKMTGSQQLLAQKQYLNLIYAYPFDILTHFPVILCHSVFGDFLKIIQNWNSEDFEITKEVKTFFEEKCKKHPAFPELIDYCVYNLIDALLSSDTEKGNAKESELVFKVVNAFRTIFPANKVETQYSTRTGKDKNMKIDASVVLENFPFIIFEAKKLAYSINAVLQGIQYYGLSESDFIDNSPCFLITFDYGILFIYGIATVNRRVVCDCLMSLEFTNYHFNINGFLEKLHHSISALYFFYQKFSERLNLIKNGESDLVHLKYLELKNRENPENNPWPAIFDIKSWENESERISFTFEKLKIKDDNGDVKLEANFKTNVFLVKIDTNNHDEKAIEIEENKNFAVLKICSTYDIECHNILAKMNFAPQIIGYEELSTNCFVVLMEYFDCSSEKYKCLFHLLNERKKLKLPLKPLHDSLKLFLAEIHKQKIVHGDFRSNNILLKNNKKADDEKEEIFEFKLIDFEFTGKIDSLYPCLSLKNVNISWPDGFSSYSPRSFKHDEFMLKEMMK